MRTACLALGAVEGLALAALALLRPSDPALETHFAPTGERRALEARIAAELKRARSEILVALFHFTSERLAQALAERRRAGVPVRVLLDAAQSDPDFVRSLRERGLDVRLATPRTGDGARYHHKYCLVDGLTVLTGSYNWTVQGNIHNHENVVIFSDRKAAEAFREDFEKAWNDKQLSQP